MKNHQTIQKKLSWSVLTLFLLLSSSSSLAKLNLKQHPVRQDIVDEIRRLTTSWIPMHPSENLLGDLAIDQLSMKLGHMDAVAQTGVRLDKIGIHYNIADSFKSVQNFMNYLTPWKHSAKKATTTSSSHLLLSEKYQKLKQEIGGEIPKSFDARDKWPNCIHGMRDQ